MTIRELAFALVLVGAACDKSATDTAPAADKPAVPTPSSPAEAKTPPAATPPTTAAPPEVRDQEACALLTPAEVGAVFGRTVVATGSGHSCTYELDPAAKQKEMDALTKGGGANAVAQMAKGGGFKMPSAISNQLVVEIGIERDTQTEDEVKAIHAKIGTTVNGTVKPDEHGLSGTLAAGKDIAGIGDWAFSTNIAAVNMGMGMSTRGRLLDARQGPWHLTVSVTIAPDPGEAKLDTELSDIARGAVAKLK